MRNGKFIILGIIAIAGSVTALGGNKALAANGWDIPLNGPSTTTTQTTSSVSLSLGSGTIQTDLDAANAAANPDEAGKVLSQTATITVGNTDGYTVYVSGNTNLTGRNNTNHKIPSITSSKTLGSMSNEWGYYAILGDSEASYNPSTSFKAMTTSQQSVGTGGATSSSVTKKLTLFYGARVTSSAAEDFYGNTVTLSVVAQPRTVTTTVTKFNGITTMQQMTASICSAAAVNDTAQLTDTRDNKKYWVTKLLDGNCWMSQNLDFNISTSNVTTATSDVTSNWTTSSTYPPQTTTASVTTGSTSNTDTYSWDLGDYVIIDPTATTACSSNSTGLSACSGQFVDVSGKTPSTDPNFYQKNGATYTATEYDAHYLAGNYYQWNAATAGTGGVIVNTDATGSICPKGWKMPKSNGNAKNTYYYLKQQYGIHSRTPGTGVDQNTYDVSLSPLFYIRSGTTSSADRWNNYHLSSAGEIGKYWGSTALDNDRLAGDFYFSSDDTSATHAPYRYVGSSLRCLVPTT